jgi:uncharacterized protein YndB with AHSA1/START domain/quinol monooxygenase YgiN
MSSRAQAITDGETVLATVDLDVPPQRAFDAMMSADVEEWWGAPGLYCFANWRSDLRVGGSWRVDVCLPNGTALPAGGEYLVVHAPYRVTMTRRYDWDHPTIGRQVTRVTYRFEPNDGGTRVIVRQDELGSPEGAREHATGWARTLDFLRAYLSQADRSEGERATGRIIDPSDDTAALIQTFRAGLRDPSQPMALLVRFSAKTGEEDKIESAFDRARSLTLREPGCRAYELNRDSRRPGGFVVYEQWRSLADLEEHFQKDYFFAVREELGALIVGPPEFEVLVPTA